MNGKLTLSRYILRPDGKDNLEKLIMTEGVKSIAPLDHYLGIVNLPFKMTVELMLRLAFWAQNQSSYEAAEIVFNDIVGVYVNDDTIRKVANYIGNIVYLEDCRRAEETYELLNSGKMPYNKNKKSLNCTVDLNPL